jgi:hypothetical protein
MAGEQGFRVVTAIICDDVRREWNGKDILIGVYGSGMRVESIPNAVILTVWLEIEAFQQGELDLWIRVIGLNDAVIFQPPAAAKLNPQIAGFSHVFVPNILVQIPSTGPLNFQISRDGQIWENIKTINVEVGPIGPTKA